MKVLLSMALADVARMQVDSSRQTRVMRENERMAAGGMRIGLALCSFCSPLLEILTNAHILESINHLCKQFFSCLLRSIIKQRNKNMAAFCSTCIARYYTTGRYGEWLADVSIRTRSRRVRSLRN